MRLLVVSPGSGWILDRIGQSVAQAGGWAWMQLGEGRADARLDATKACSWTGKVEPARAEAVFYWDVQNCWGESWRDALPGVIHVGAFTHLDKDSPESYRPHWGKLDGIVHMARRYERVFAEQGWYPPERMTVIPPGEVTGFRLRPLRLGVCQRGGFPGKGDPFLFEALANLSVGIRQHIELCIKGTGWDNSLAEWLPKLDPMKVVLDETEGQLSYPAFYEGLDYLLIPSLWEGGPMSLIEALACGLPVITAEVGWVPEMTEGLDYQDVLDFEPGNHRSLQTIITMLVERRAARRARVAGLTWQSYAERLKAFVETLR